MAKQPIKDPKGGLTAAGRAHFKRTEGANLKPGVKGAVDTPEKMRRKGSFLTRFFTNPSGPMQDDKGRPTRLALSASAWGEPVPKNRSDAAKLAAKGRRLLERYEKTKGKKKVTKHANHDQSSHGNWAKAGTAGGARRYKTKAGELIDAAPEPDYDELVDAARMMDHDKALSVGSDIFDLKIETEDGNEVEAKVTSAYATEERVSVRGKIYVDGTREGEFKREFDTKDKNDLSVYNSLFLLSSSYQGMGIGTTILRHWEDQLKRAGVDTMTVTAASNYLMNGAYTWAKYGYTPKAGEMQYLMQEFSSTAIDESNAKEIAKAFGLSDEVEKSIKDVLARGGNPFMPWSAKNDYVDMNKSRLNRDILWFIENVTGFGQFLKNESVEWSGSKVTKLISKRDSLSEDLVAVCNRWMAENPVGLENDDPQFFADLKAVREKHSRQVAKHGDHDQSTHGNWAKKKRKGKVGEKLEQIVAATGKSAKQLKAMALDGGFTFNPKRGEKRSSGFVSAIDQKYEQKVPASEFTTENISQYASTHSEVLARPNHHLGAWREEVGGVDYIFLDVSVVLPTIEEAAEVGRKYSQLAVFDLNTFTQWDGFKDPSGKTVYMDTPPYSEQMLEALGKADGSQGVMLVPGEMLDSKAIELMAEELLKMKPSKKSPSNS